MSTMPGSSPPSPGSFLRTTGSGPASRPAGPPATCHSGPNDSTKMWTSRPVPRCKSPLEGRWLPTGTTSSRAFPQRSYHLRVSPTPTPRTTRRSTPMRSNLASISLRQSPTVVTTCSTASGRPTGSRCRTPVRAWPGSSRSSPHRRSRSSTARGHVIDEEAYINPGHAVYYVLTCDVDAVSPTCTTPVEVSTDHEIDVDETNNHASDEDPIIEPPGGLAREVSGRRSP